MSCEAFDIEAALEKCHKGTAWQRDLIRAQLISAQADAFERAAKVAAEHDVAPTDDPLGVQECIVDAIRALAKESK